MLLKIQMKYLIILLFLFSSHSISKENLSSLKKLCFDIEAEILDLELMKKNLKKEFKNIKDELEQFELLPELTKDINNTLIQQIQQAKLYHYLDCPRFSK